MIGCYYTRLMLLSHNFGILSILRASYLIYDLYLAWAMYFIQSNNNLDFDTTPWPFLCLESDTLGH